MMPYIINAGLILTGCLAFYKLLLQKETFYRLNRYILIVCLLAAFSLPLLRVPQQISFRKAETTIVHVQPVPTGEIISPEQRNDHASATGNSTVTAANNNNSAATGISFAQVMTWLVYLYWFGVIVFAFNFLIQVAVLLYRAYSSPVIHDGPFRIVEISGDKAPCSFGNNIFINPEKYDWDTYSQILEHEKVHIRQGHSLDILLSELVLIFQWFNPFAWLYRKEVESNLEFLTDDQLVHKQEIEKASYQLSLLKVSSPHFPLSLTTNYNQSLLKKRIVMMNAKKSNVHTAWKYFFLMPLLVLFAALLNEPVAYGQETPTVKKEDKGPKKEHRGIDTEGVWFATIKDDRISINFKRDDDQNTNSFNGTSFELSEFPNLPRDKSGSFSLKREAGTMEFTGRFEGNEGMGRYRFVPDAQYASYMNNQNLGTLDDRDMMTFFFIDVKKDYLQMLRSEGFTSLSKNDLIPLAALKVDRAFISSMRSQFKDKDLVPHNFVTLKALKISDEYIREIRDAGYKDISVDQIVAFKSQGIDKTYLAKVNNMNLKNKKDNEETMSAHQVVALKSLKIDDEYVNSFKQVGLSDISNDNIVAMKSLNITPDYVKNFQQMGYTDLDPSDIIAFKSLNITPDFIKSFETAGYKNIPANQLHALKSLHITPDYIRSYEAIGYTNIPLSQFPALKSMKVTPEYIKSMKEKGFDYKDVSKYIQLKSITE